MNRRAFLKGIGAGALTLSLPIATRGARRLRWKMVTSWPNNFPGLGTGAEKLAQRINQMSGGRLQVKVYAAGELVPPFEVFDAVSRGTAQMGHTGPYYWKGKHEAIQFFSAVPFGFTAQEIMAWLSYGGGMDLWRKLYGTFNLVPMAAGNTGCQMFGWFRKEIKGLADLKGLKMRIPGLGGEVLRRLGGVPVNIPGGELFTALQSGTIDAAEWVGPYNDLAFGLYKAAKFYYYPGWHEPGSVIECFINREAFEGLPADLQRIVEEACRASVVDMLAEYTARNQRALDTLIQEHGVKLRRLPDDVLKAFKEKSEEVLQEIAKKDALAREIYDSFSRFRAQVIRWTNIAEFAFMQARFL